MKKFLLLLCVAVLFMSCQKTTDEPIPSSDSDPTKTSDDGNTKSYTIIPDDGTWTETDGVITFAPAEEKTEYTISGTYTGQLKNTVKGTKITLNGFTITNDAAPAIYGELKTEISAAEGTENFITGAGDAAFLCEKAIEIGGSGTVTIKGTEKHGVKGGDITVKGSGTYTVEGTADGSAINCNNFEVKEEKTFTLNIQNSKNGIKADETITIASGTFNITDCNTALKTDTSKDDDTVDHFIKLLGGTFTSNAKKFYSTENDAYDASGATINE